MAKLKAPKSKVKKSKFPYRCTVSLNPVKSPYRYFDEAIGWLFRNVGETDRGSSKSHSIFAPEYRNKLSTDNPENVMWISEIRKVSSWKWDRRINVVFMFKNAEDLSMFLLAHNFDEESMKLTKTSIVDPG